MTNLAAPSTAGSVTAGAAIGCDFDFRVLFVVHMLIEDEFIRIISARKADPAERKCYEDGND